MTGLIAGLSNEREDLSESETRDAVTERANSRVTTNASVMEYTEVTISLAAPGLPFPIDPVGIRFRV